jgi:hypothetical protein
MHRTIQIHINKGEEGWYVAEAVHLPVVTQGKTSKKWDFTPVLRW